MEEEIIFENQNPIEEFDELELDVAAEEAPVTHGVEETKEDE